MKKILVEIVLTKGVITPEELSNLIKVIEDKVQPGSSEGIILSGRLPVWVFTALGHVFHPRPWVATYDPRLSGGVVVASHTADIAVGDVISVDDDTERIEVEF